MWFQIAVFIGVCVLAGLVFAFFVQDLIAIIVNAIIIYLLALRVHAELKHKKRVEVYLASGLVSVLIVWLWNPFPLWQLSSLLILTFVLAHAWMYLKKP